MPELRPEWAAEVSGFLIPCDEESQARRLAGSDGRVRVRQVTEWEDADE